MSDPEQYFNDKPTEILAMLKDVDNAIKAVLLGGASYTINSGGGSRTVTNADLPKLRELKEALETELRTYTTRGAAITVAPGF